jgi:hypothetical protein
VFTTAEELAPFVRSIGLPDLSLSAMV